MGLELAQETVWFDKWRYDDAEANFHAQKTNLDCGSVPADAPEEESSAAVAVPCSRVQQQTPEPQPQGRLTITNAAAPADVLNRVTKLEGENSTLRKSVESLEQSVKDLTERLAALECSCRSAAATNTTIPAATKPVEEDDDDDVDLFGSDDDEEEESAEAARIREERLKSYAEKKSKKVTPVAKSSVLLDCKPWDDETDFKKMEAAIRDIKMDGLVWGAAKLVPLAFGIHKLSILVTVVDEKVSIDDLSEQIEAIEEYVQSVDVAAFNKV
uniref:Elongation factor 1-delta-like n=1 Tax=Hirondellea gigas TaxID=1518452 RepID=A0A2P2I049_9CRUS